MSLLHTNGKVPRDDSADPRSSGALETNETNDTIGKEGNRD